MALRKLYTVAVITVDGRLRPKLTDHVIGFTVARSSDEVEDIVRKHVRCKRFFVYHCSDGSGDPAVARQASTTFLVHHFRWLDPRGPNTRDLTPVPVLVARLMTQDIAL